MKKKLKIGLILFFAIGFTSNTYALRLYCGANNTLWVVNWFTGSDGNTGFTVSSAGSCEGGPWMAIMPSPQSKTEKHLNLIEAPGAVYSTLKLFSKAGVIGTASTDLGLNAAISAASESNQNYWVNPDEIDPEWAKTLAIDNGKSIYALDLIGHPFRNVMQFDVWSTCNQNINVTIVDVNNGSNVYNDVISLREGKNRRITINMTRSLNGNYSLRLASTSNTEVREILFN